MGRARVVAPPPKDYVPVPLNVSGINVDLPQEATQSTNEIIENLVETPTSADVVVTPTTEVIVEKAKRKTNKKEREILASRSLGLYKKKNESLEEEVKQLKEQIVRIENESAGSISTLKSLLHSTQDERNNLLREKENVAVRNRDANNEESRLRAKLAEENKKVVAELTQKIIELNQQLITAKEDALVQFREEQTLKKIKEQVSANITEIHEIKSLPTWYSNLIAFFKRKKIELTMKTITNMDAAIIVRAKYAIPRMLDDIEKIHEQLSILEEMISMLQKSKNPKENPDLDQ